MDTYFLGILDYEQKKADAGLFMSDEACLKVIEGCEVFTEHPDDNFLIDTFSNRLNAMDGLTDTQKNAYLKQHSKVLSDHVIPAYSQMIKGLTMLLGRGHNNWGLCNFPEGKAYYEAVVSADTGCDDSVEDLFSQIAKARREDLTFCQNLLEKNPKLASQSPKPDAALKEENSMLSRLQKEILTDFPAPPQTEVEICHEDIPESFDGYRIAQFSDLHLGTYKVYAEDVPARLRDRINEVNADLIVFTGDIVNNRANELDGFENQLKGMKAKDGIYAIMGNHDYSTYIYWKSAEKRKENIRNLQDRMGAQGWKWLLNQHKIIRRGQDSIALIGVENDGNPHFPALADLPKATEGLERPMFKILLSHDPTHWRREVLDSTDIQLQLSGHTHGMQLELFGLSPAKFIYPD